MALRELNFTFTPDDPRPLPVGWFHRGVTGSGDMEVMLEQRNLAGDVQVKVCTPVVGFDEVWERVLEAFRQGERRIRCGDRNQRQQRDSGRGVHAPASGH